MFCKVRGAGNGEVARLTWVSYTLLPRKRKKKKEKSNVREEANGFLANTVFVERTQKGVMKLECEGPVLCEGQGLLIGYLLWQIKKLK